MFLRIFSVMLLGLSPFLSGEDNEKEDPGLVVFRERCMACHLTTGMGIREMNAPSIAGLPRWYVADQLRKFRRDQRGFHEDDLSGHLMQVNAVALDERSIAFVGRFIENLEGNQDRNTTGLELSNQAEKSYLQNCASCHGESAEGNRSLRIPPLTRQQDWYLLGQMANFAEKKRVHHEEKQEEMSDEDLKAIIAWICELPTPDK